VVVDGETGLLVAMSANYDQYSRDLAAAINVLMDSPAKLETMGRKARQRVERCFSWTSIARQTRAFYKELSS
jgi:starch synthase